jgi:hypothetical protein
VLRKKSNLTKEGRKEGRKERKKKERKEDELMDEYMNGELNDNEREHIERIRKRSKIKISRS